MIQHDCFIGPLKMIPQGRQSMVIVNDGSEADYKHPATVSP
jgi:hypothetical protein